MRRRPTLPAPAEWFYAAFLVLNRGRQAGFAANPIPLTEIEAFLRIQQITDPDQAMFFVRVMARMDAVWLEHATQKTSPKN